MPKYICHAPYNHTIKKPNISSSTIGGSERNIWRKNVKIFLEIEHFFVKLNKDHRSFLINFHIFS